MNLNSVRSRREFLVMTSGTAIGSNLLGRSAWGGQAIMKGRTVPVGPASSYVPKISAAFVRRQENYGIRWPGAIFDGEAALGNYRQKLVSACKELGVELELRSAPIFSETEASRWVAEIQNRKPDGIWLGMLDRQDHSWPTAYQAVKTGIPCVVFAPVGTAFTTNTEPLAEQEGVYIASTDDFSQACAGIKMLKAGAKLRESRFIVLQGDERREERVPQFGTRLRYVPAREFLKEYEHTPVDEEVRGLAAHYLKEATRVAGPSEQDVMNGVKSYMVARRFLEQENGDGITMDCLGALGSTQVSLPCIAWSKMLDDGVPAACEADIGAALTHALVQYLFERPGFQQDPVPETGRECLIGAHCTCPTRLKGFSQPPEPFFLSYHHGKRDAVPVPTWEVGRRMTVASLMPSSTQEKPPEMIVSSGAVVENVAVPPSGGCVVSVMVKLDNVSDLLDYPGFHQIFFYGDFKKELKGYCRLFRIRPIVV